MTLVLERRYHLFVYSVKKSRYNTGSKIREPLVPCCEFRGDARITEAATTKGIVRIMTLLAAGHDAIAVEAHYHNSCYRNYTRMSSANTIVATGTTESPMEKSIYVLNKTN